MLVSLIVKRWIVFVLALYLSLICEFDIGGFVPASKCRGCVVFERGVVYSQLLYCPKSSVEVPCVGVMCRQVSENPSCEDGDVELCARSSKQISCLRLIH